MGMNSTDVYDYEPDRENITTENIVVNVTSTNVASHVNTILSDKNYDYYAYIIYSFVIPSICFCGFVGNCMAVAVLSRTARQRKQSIYIYMCALTIVDTIYMLISIVRCLPVIIRSFDKKLYNYIYCHSLAAMVYFDISVSAISVVILILMSTERLIAIRNPLSVKNTVIAKRPFLFIACTCIFVFLTVAPLPFMMKVTESITYENETIYETIIDPQMADIFETYVATETFLLSYLPFVSILGLNIAIPIQYRKTRKQCNQMLTSVNVSVSNNLRIMATVFIVTLMYSLLALPQMFIQTLSIIDQRFSVQGSEENMFWFLSDISNMLINLNMAIDFIIYILMSKIYRERFWAMFCRKPEILNELSTFSSSDLS